jgi:hypothetical protein
LLSFWQQNFHYGQGAYLYRQIVTQEQPKQGRRQPFSFYVHLILYPLKTQTHHSRLHLLFLFLVSQLAVISGYFYLGSKASLKPSPI